MKRALNPNDAYWRAQADLLAVQNPALYERCREHVFNEWNGPSIGEARKLSQELVTKLTNLYNYADITFLKKIKRAIRQREHEIRRGQNEARILRRHNNGLP